MGRKSYLDDQEFKQTIIQYETARSENKKLYFDADQLAKIVDYYACNKEYEKAQEIIDYGFCLHPENTYLLIEQAYLYLDIHNVPQAKKTAHSIKEAFLSEVKLLKAEICLLEGSLAGAEEVIETIEKPYETDDIIDIAYLYLDMGYVDQAKEWMDKGTERSKKGEDFMGLMADYLSNTDNFEKASDCYEKLIDIDPFNPFYWIGLAKCCFATEKCEKAIESCDFALAIDEQCGEAYAYRAHGYFFLNNADEAIVNYLKAIEYNSIAPEMGYMFLGMAHTSNENWSEAYKYYQMVFQLFEEKEELSSPLLIDTYAGQAIAACKLGYYEESHQLCKKAKALFPCENTVYATEGKLFLLEGLEDEADKIFEEALKIDSSAEILLQIGMIYSEMEMIDTAKYYMEEAYAKNPLCADLKEKLTILCLMNNEIDDFFKYNNECNQPINEAIIMDLLSNYNNADEGKDILEEVLERMRREQ